MPYVFCVLAFEMLFNVARNDYMLEFVCLTQTLTFPINMEIHVQKKHLSCIKSIFLFEYCIAKVLIR